MKTAWILGLSFASGCAGGDPCDEDALDLCEYGSPALGFSIRDVAVTDDVTGRALPLRVRIPEGDGPFPVVLYSHGGGFNETGHVFGAEWGEALASHGYVTASIGHVPAASVSEAELLCGLASIPESECTLDLLQDEDSGAIAFVKRRDVIGVLDALPDLAARGEELGGVQVDLDRVALMGWSAGSRSTMTTRGTAFFPSPSAPLFSESDDRVRSVIALSPTGPGFGGFFEDGDGTSWDSMEGPSLLMTGQNDVKENNPGLTGAIRRRAYEDQPADGTRRLLYSNLAVGVGGHPTYNLADQDSGVPELDRLSRAMVSAARAHLDATLSDDTEAQAWLDSDAALVLAGDVDWERK